MRLLATVKQIFTVRVKLNIEVIDFPDTSCLWGPTQQQTASLLHGASESVCTNEGWMTFPLKVTFFLRLNSYNETSSVGVQHLWKGEGQE